MNVSEIERSLRLLVAPGATFEVRALGTERGREVTLSGYFTDPAQAAKEIAQTCRGMTGIYTTLNPVRPELLARCAHRIAHAKKNGTTSDHHVTARKRLLIDIDGVPVAGISASDAEHRAALDLASEIEHELAQRGWPQPLRGDSGNGAHLDYAIDLPADDGGLVERVLQAAQQRFGCTLEGPTGQITLKIDTSNKNPARITKIFGTPARKGDNVPDRPHRMSRIISAPEQLEAVSRELLEQFADEYASLVAAPRPPRHTQQAHLQQPRTLDVQDWLAKHSIQVKRVNQSWQGKQGPGTCYELDECPGNSDHNRGEAYVIQHSSGAISAGCQHQSCSWDWQWLRERYEPLAERTRAQAPAPSAASQQQRKDELAAKREQKRRQQQADVQGSTGHPGIGPRGGYRLTDLGNAKRFADMHHTKMRYVHAWNQWIVWDGKRWRRDPGGADVHAARAVTASIYQDAARSMSSAAAAVSSGAPVEGIGQTLAKWAGDSAKRARIEAMIALARSEQGLMATQDQFNRDPWLLNVANGTVDLRDGELRPHRQADMITMLSDVEYLPDAAAPEWQRFIEEVLPDPEVRGWVQRYLGYCLTGLISEQQFAFWVGKGGNGKNVCIDAIVSILGEYAIVGAPELLLEKHSDSHPTELADIEGRRLVVCSEIEQGRSWAEGRIKEITGNKRIKARRMKQDFFEFEATSKLVVLANTKPKVRSADNGLWRRMNLVPWTVQIPHDRRDKHLLDRLVHNEKAGILKWLVDGCIAWQNHGLGEARAITIATAEYRKQEDILGLWIEDRCCLEPDVETPTTALYEDYKKWCESEGIDKPWTLKAWRARLIEREGITDTRTMTSRGISGIRLLGFGELPL